MLPVTKLVKLFWLHINCKSELQPETFNEVNRFPLHSKSVMETNASIPIKLEMANPFTFKYPVYEAASDH